MKNGDRMTCQIKRLERGVLYVDFDYIDGTASVDWSKVDRLESNQLFVVKTEDGSVYKGRLAASETNGIRAIEIHVIDNPEEEVVIEPSKIVRVTATSDNFWERFDGGLSLGATYSKGNQSTQYNLGSRLAYLRERWSASASFDSNLSSSTGANVSTRNSLKLSALHLLPSNNWFYSGVGDFLQSSEQGIALQTTLGGGIGRYLTNTNRSSIAVTGGVAWQSTDYKQTVVTPSGQNVVAALISAKARLFKFNKTTLDVDAVFLPALSDPGRVRFNTDASYYIKLFSNLKWNLSFYGNWDNRPPPGFSGSDYGTSSGISWTFGLK